MYFVQKSITGAIAMIYKSTCIKAGLTIHMNLFIYSVTFQIVSIGTGLTEVNKTLVDFVYADIS